MIPVNGEGSRLDTRVLAYIRAHGLLSAGEKVLVAVSGGADSMALLLLLSALRPALSIAIEAAHYEHGIRGEASRQDAQFVEVFCAARGIPCHVAHGDVPALASWRRISLEDAARQARYAFLDDTAKAIGAQKIALAHQLEDQAETLLLHLVHGSGITGLAGMRPMQSNRIRPLLDTPRADIEAFLTAQNIPWREDVTNADTAHARNLLRHEVFPVLRRLNPRVSEAMARTADLCAQAADALQAQARVGLEGSIKRMPYGAFWAAPGGSLDAEAARMFCGWAGVSPLDARQTEALCSLAPGMTANLPDGWRGYRSKTRLHLIAPRQLEAPAMGRLACGEGNARDMGDGIRRQAFDADKLEGVELRFRREGDLFAPLGTRGTQKLKQTLSDMGLDRPFRDILPVFVRENRVLWIVGIKPSQDAAVGPETRRITMMEYHGELPWEII